MKSFCVGVSRGDFHQGEGDWSRLGGREILASRTGVEPRGAGVPAVKEKGPIVIQENLAAWIARYRTLRTQGNAIRPLMDARDFPGPENLTNLSETRYLKRAG